MHFKLVCRPGAALDTKPVENNGYDLEHVKAALQALQARGKNTYVLLDTTGFADSERWALYNSMAAPAAWRRHYVVNRVFGTDAAPGMYFGAEVPALTAYEQADDPLPRDIWPHKWQDGPLVTIAEFLGLTSTSRARVFHKRHREVDHRLEVGDPDALVGAVEVVDAVGEVETAQAALVEDVRVGGPAR